MKKLKLNLIAALVGVIALTAQNSWASEGVDVNAQDPNLCAFLSLHNINICLFKTTSGRRYLEIRTTRWISMKPVKTETSYEYTLMSKTSETQQGATWTGYNINQEKSLKLSERVMELNVQKVGEEYVGKLFVNGENWSGWSGSFVLEPR